LSTTAVTSAVRAPPSRARLLRDGHRS
jgi:hypothetical protein